MVNGVLYTDKENRKHGFEIHEKLWELVEYGSKI